MLSTRKSRRLDLCTAVIRDVALQSGMNRVPVMRLVKSSDPGFKMKISSETFTITVEERWFNPSFGHRVFRPANTSAAMVYACCRAVMAIDYETNPDRTMDRPFAFDLGPYQVEADAIDATWYEGWMPGAISRLNRLLPATLALPDITPRQRLHDA